MRNSRTSVLAFSGFLAAAMLWLSPARGVSTSHWTQENEGDFKAGTAHNVVITNLGDVKLSRAMRTLQEQDPNVTAVNALAQSPSGTVYAGTSPKAILLAVKDGKVSQAATVADAVSILSLAFGDKDQLFAGTAGEAGEVVEFDHPGQQPRVIFTAPGVQYVWGLQRTPDGNLYAATGPNGQVFEIHPDGSHQQVYKGSENNITTLLSDGGDLLYLGTDPNGLVVRFNRKTRESFILYNAGESEITALAFDRDHNLYAATGQAGESQGNQPSVVVQKPGAGRAEPESGGTPIPARPIPAPPAPPSVPKPNPGEPRPIPSTQQSMRIDALRPLMLDDNGPDNGGGGDNGNGDNGNGGDNGGGDNGNGPEAGAEMGGGGPEKQDQSQGPQAAPTPENAIYRIDRDGFVTEVFRQSAVIYSMIAQNNVLIVGTGPDGNIYQVDPAAQENVVLAKADAKQVSCLLGLADGQTYCGLANTGGISVLTPGYADSGTYTSAVMDATQVSRFGVIHLHGYLPDGTALQVSTRSGNVRDADAMGWSPWTPDRPAEQFMKIDSPSARFLQYRLTFSTTNPANTPLVDRADVAYQIPNMAPVIHSVKVGGQDASSQGQGGQQSPAPKTQGTGSQTITWDASDPNNDTLVYSLYFRQSDGPWILLKNHLKDASFDWDTRTVADGRYQVKVVASDAPSNLPDQAKTAERISDAFIVDNTPPVIGDVSWRRAGANVQVSLRVQDRISTIANVDYTVDSSEDWNATLPVNGIFDNPDERVVIELPDLTPGLHQVTIRATDSRGNQALQTLQIDTTATTRGSQ